MKKQTLTFLKDLAAHNDRAWFKAHRPGYLAARDDVVDEVARLQVAISAFDPGVVEMDPESALFRIYRDTRFAGSKAPYKTNFGAFLTNRGRDLARAGYYLHVEPGRSFVAGGLYRPPAPELRKVREALDKDAAPLRRILKRPAFQKAFGKELAGDRLKTAPRDYPKDHPEIDFLRLKSFEVMHPVSDKMLTSKGFEKEAARLYRLLQDFNNYLNAALDAG